MIIRNTTELIFLKYSSNNVTLIKKPKTSFREPEKQYLNSRGIKKNTNNNQFRKRKLKILEYLIPRHYGTIVRKVARHRQNTEKAMEVKPNSSCL